MEKFISFINENNEQKSLIKVMQKIIIGSTTNSITDKEALKLIGELRNSKFSLKDVGVKIVSNIKNNKLTIELFNGK